MSDAYSPATYLWNLTTGAVTTLGAFAPVGASLTSLGDAPTGGMAFTADGTKFVASGSWCHLD